MRQLLAAVLIAGAMLSVSPVARAADPIVEASMQLAGTIEVDAQGNVTAYAIDRASGYPDAILKVVDGLVRQWRFEPVLVDGEAHPARAAMYLLFVARKVEGGDFAISLRSANFGADDSEAGVTLVETKKPQYPLAELKEHATGITYIAMQVGPDGRVRQTHAEQTNLYTMGSPREMTRWRRDFERAAESSVRDWVFKLPPQDVAEGGITMRVPVAFTTLGRQAQDSLSGQWSPYLPGEYSRAPWLDVDYTAGGVDALPDGMVQKVGSGLKLLTPLNAP